MSLGDIFNTIIITILFFLIFSIMFVNMFKGKLYYCTDYGTIFPDQTYFSSEWECLNSGGTWSNRKYTYDSVPNAMLTLFHKSITVGWAETMYDQTKVTGIGSSVSSEKQSPLNALYSVMFMIFCSLFMLNIFIGIVISTFNREEIKISKKHLINEF